MVLLFVLAASMGLVLYVVPVFLLYGSSKMLLRAVRSISSRSRARPALRRVASQFDLGLARRSLLLGDRLSGAIAGFDIEITPPKPHAASKHQAPGNMQLTLRMSEELPHRLSIFSRRSFPKGAMWHGEPLRTFDESFDEKFVVHGRILDVTARLDALVRRHLTSLVRQGEVRVEGREITLVTDEAIHNSLAIVSLIQNLVVVARDLKSEGPSVADRLLANALSEPTLAVRYQNLDLLLREYVGSPQAEEALRIAWDAPERGIRYLAAVRMGAQGIELLKETAVMPSEPSNLRIMSLRHLARHAPREQVTPILDRLMRDDSLLVQRTAIELVGRLQHRAALLTLISISRQEPCAEETRVIVAQALGNLGDPTAESYLLALLENDELLLKIAASTALGKIGTVASLRPLGHVKKRFAAVRDLAQAASTAIARIETRNGPAERGQLSLAATRGGDGALSLPELSGGELSTSSTASAEISNDEASSSA